MKPVKKLLQSFKLKNKKLKKEIKESKLKIKEYEEKTKRTEELLSYYSFMSDIEPLTPEQLTMKRTQVIVSMKWGEGG